MNTLDATFEGRQPYVLSEKALRAFAQKVMLIGRKIDPATLEPHSLGFQQESLLEAVFPRQGDTASRSQHSLPGKARYLVQDLGDVTRTPGIARSLGDGAISTDSSAGNPADHCGYSHGKWGLETARTLHHSR